MAVSSSLDSSLDKWGSFPLNGKTLLIMTGILDACPDKFSVPQSYGRLTSPSSAGDASHSLRGSTRTV
jgi:hypothetical protein